MTDMEYCTGGYVISGMIRTTRLLYDDKSVIVAQIARDDFIKSVDECIDRYNLAVDAHLIHNRINRGMLMVAVDDKKYEYDPENIKAAIEDEFRKKIEKALNYGCPKTRIVLSGGNMYVFDISYL